MKKLLLLILLLSTPLLVSAQSGGTGTAASIYRTPFTNLGTPADGSVRYCTDCTPNTSPATGGGTGAFVSRVNGVWVAATSGAAGAGTVTSVSGTSGQISVTSPTTTPLISLANVGTVTPGAYTNPNITVDSKGRVTAAANGTAGVGGSGTVNTLAKFTPDGTTVGDSRAIDLGAGASFTIDTPNSSFDVGDTTLTNGLTRLYVNDAEVEVFAQASTESLTLSGGAHTATLTVATAINLDSKGGVTTLGDVGNNFNHVGLSIDDASSTIAPLTGGGVQLGSAALPFASVAVGNAANNSSQITSLATTNRANALPDADGTIALVGVNAPNLTNSISLTAQSASIGTTNIQIAAAAVPAGTYRLTYYMVTTTAGTSGMVQATFGWSDQAAARTQTSPAITFGTLAAPASGSIVMKTNGVANITYATTVTSAIGSPVYALYITLERLQ